MVMHKVEILGPKYGSTPQVPPVLVPCGCWLTEPYFQVVPFGNSIVSLVAQVNYLHVMT